jgi:hypothetical protein
VTQDASGCAGARNAGIDVPEKLMNKAIEYRSICQNADGGIRYSVESVKRRR